VHSASSAQLLVAIFSSFWGGGLLHTGPTAGFFSPFFFLGGKWPVCGSVFFWGGKWPVCGSVFFLAGKRRFRDSFFFCRRDLVLGWCLVA
jgi:hypothetical protein